jgi:hypothetical protein
MKKKKRERLLSLEQEMHVCFFSIPPRIELLCKKRQLSFSPITLLVDCKPVNILENKFVEALEHFSLVPFSQLILNETILIIFSISRRLENFAAHLANLAAHPLRITGPDVDWRTTLDGFFSYVIWCCGLD